MTLTHWLNVSLQQREASDPKVGLEGSTDSGSESDGSQEPVPAGSPSMMPQETLLFELELKQLQRKQAKQPLRSTAWATKHLAESKGIAQAEGLMSPGSHEELCSTLFDTQNHISIRRVPGLSRS